MRTERDVQTLLDTDLPAHRMFLGEFDTWAVGSELVAKFPRSARESGKVRVEAAIHPLLRSLLGDVVPALRMVGELEDGTGFPYMVHERARGAQGQTVEGVTIEPGRGLAEHVGSLFSKLHAIEGDEALTRGVGERRVRFESPDASDEAIAAVIEIAGDEAAAHIESSPPAPSDRRVLCHTDVKGEHVFVDERGAAVTAIIDWADTEVCDPARDYAGVIDWLGPSFGRAVIEASDEPDPTLFERALWLSRARLFEWMHDRLTGVEDAPESLLRQQIQTAFGP